jgi:ATP-dependent RNA helicase RhlE
VSLVSGEDRTLLRDIERLIGKKIEQRIVPGFEPGSGYHHAQPEPQIRRGRRQESQPRRPEKSRSARRDQGNGRPVGPMRGGQPSAQPRQGQAQRRDHGRRQEQRAAITPMDKDLHAVREQQLEYHRKQMAEENRNGQQVEYHRQQVAEEHRRVAAPAKERKKANEVPALFGWVGRKVA